MALYVREFVVEDVADIHLAFNRVLRAALAVERQDAAKKRPSRAAATLREVRIAYARFNDELDALARGTARDAQKRMRDKFEDSRSIAGRPRTGSKGGLHLKGALVARPERPVGKLATGVVGVADVERLDRVVNPTGPEYGPYWRTQEYGYGGHVGRQVYGYFTKAGYGTPWARADPGRRGEHPIFVAGRPVDMPGSVQGGIGPKGGRGSRMVIRNPIRPRHFIRDGANDARADWKLGVARVEAAAEARLNRALRG